LIFADGAIRLKKTVSSFAVRLPETSFIVSENFTVHRFPCLPMTSLILRIAEVSLSGVIVISNGSEAWVGTAAGEAVPFCDAMAGEEDVGEAEGAVLTIRSISRSSCRGVT